MTKITALIPCYNAEKTIRATLESVKWMDEILVVDSFSTDKTIDICREYTDRILQHPYINSANQKNWAIPQCRNEWVFQIDTDEVLEPGGEEEIRRVLKENVPSVHAYQLPIKNFYYGKWLKHGGLYPDYHTRLFRKGPCRFQTKEVHARVIGSGEIGTLKHHILHNDFKDYGTWLIKIERYMGYEVEELAKKRKRFHLVRMTIYPWLVFLITYFWKRAFLDGYRGFLYSVLQSFYYFSMYAKYWEYRWKREKKK